MKKSEFKFLTNFKPHEVERLDCEVKDINFSLMWSLQLLRSNLGCPIRITSLTNGKHASGSFHYPENTPSGECEAVDFNVMRRIPKNKVLQFALDSGFTGIGVYRGFYHCDIRGDYKLWKRVKGKYLPLI